MLRLAALCITAALCIKVCTSPIAWPGEAFSSEIWKKTPDRQRHELVNDLLHRHLLDNKSKNEVIEILGPPSGQLENPRGLTYVINTGGYSFDQVFILDIRFADGWEHVTQAGVRGD